MKVCVTCNIEKEDNGFRKYCKKCRKCEHQSRKEYYKEYWGNNSEKRKLIVQRYKKSHSSELRRKSKVYGEKNKETILIKGKLYREKNRDKERKRHSEYNKNSVKRQQYNKKYMKEYSKEYRLRERTKAYYKKYREINAETLCDKTSEFRKSNPSYCADYARERRKIDDLFRLSGNLRGRISLAFRRNGYVKNCKTEIILGAPFSVVKTHIESKLKDGMTMDKIGREIHIDHIIPLASAKTEYELIALCHYTNLQPLWAIDNIKKGAKIINETVSQ